jgi:trehalose/maltose hydrolase-like predicted phosphorylase
MPANVTAEAFPKTKAKWGTYVPGIYGKHPFLNNELVNLPWFLGLAPIAEGERLDLEQSRVEACRRELQMKDALWRRSLIWKTRAGASVTVSFERFVSAARPSLCVQRMSLEGNRNIDVQIDPSSMAMFARTGSIISSMFHAPLRKMDRSPAK